MEYFFELEGLTYNMVTLDNYDTILRNVGYVDVDLTDITNGIGTDSTDDIDLTINADGALFVGAIDLADAGSDDGVLDINVDTDNTEAEATSTIGALSNIESITISGSNDADG